MVDWPSQLPSPRLEEFTWTPHDNVVRTQFNSGQFKQRLRYPTQPYSAEVVITMDNFQYEIFTAWHKFKIAFGSIPFTFSAYTSTGYVSFNARMASQPTARKISDISWVVEFEIQAQELPTISEGQLDDILEGTTDGILSSIDAFHTLLHSKLPLRLR